MLEFIQNYGLVIAFYGIIILLLYLNRKKFDRPAKLVFLYKTKVGLKLMDKWCHPPNDFQKKWGPRVLYTGLSFFLLGLGLLLASFVTFTQLTTLGTILVLAGLLFFGVYSITEKNPTYYVIAFTLAIAGLISYISHSLGADFSLQVGYWLTTGGFLLFVLALFMRPVKHAGYIGIWAGYLGMVTIVGFLVYGVYALFQNPDAPPVVTPVIPGVPIPGSPIQVPLIAGWIALFVAIIVHEFSHGVVSRAHGIKVKASGLAFFGPIGGAFVEPDEKALKKHKKRVQNAIFAAGPFSNMIAAGVFHLLTLLLILPLMGFLSPVGVQFHDLVPDGPAELAGLQEDLTYNKLNGIEFETSRELIDRMQAFSPGDTITLSSNQDSVDIVLQGNPNDPEKPYMGVFLETAFDNEDTALAKVWLWILKVLQWIVIINLGLGLANLLPLGPVDGGRMFHVAALHFMHKNKAQKVWTKTTMILFIVLIFLVFVPIIRASLQMIFK